GAAVYAASITFPFIFDDQLTVIENSTIREISTSLAPAANTALEARPLASLSFAINYAIGGTNVAGYHIVNIALHPACGLLLFGIARRTLVPLMPASATDVAWVSALVWTLHPLNSEVVNYVTQRTESMMALCYLLVIYANIRRWEWMAVVVCFLGMACKE